MPEGRAPEDTAEALLASARELFARHGYDGASIRAITRHAGANIGAVNYHFGSKRDLYRHVIDRVVGPLVDRVTAVAARPEPPLDRLEAALRVIFDHLARTPDHPFLLVQEIVAGPPPSPEIAALLERASGALAAVVREGQEEGTIRPGEPLLIAMSVVSQPVYLSLARRLLGSGPDAPSAPAGSMIARWREMDPERVVDHAVAFARSALRTPDPGASP